MKIYLFHISGSNKGYTDILDLEEGQSVTIGRHPENQLQLDPELDLNASGFHAELAFDGEAFTVQDVGSSFGTFVNGKPVSETDLSSRDKVQFGTEGPVVKVYLDRDVKHCTICEGPLLKRNFVCYDCQEKVCFRHYEGTYGVCEVCASSAAEAGISAEAYRAGMGFDPLPAEGEEPPPPEEPPDRGTKEVPTGTGQGGGRGGRKHRGTVVVDTGQGGSGGPSDRDASGSSGGSGRGPRRKTVALDLTGGPPPPSGGADRGGGASREEERARPEGGCGICGDVLSGAWFTCKACGRKCCLAHFYVDDTCQACARSGQTGVRREGGEDVGMPLGGDQGPSDVDTYDPEQGPGATTSGQLKRCPFCAEAIQVKAIKCKHCKEYLTEPQGMDMAPEDDLPLIDMDDID